MTIPIKQRITVLSNNKVEQNQILALHLSRARWVLPPGEYQRQDRFVIPHETAVKQLQSPDLQTIDEFLIQWGAFNNSVVSKLLEVKNRELKNINNAFSKYIEPGYSIFINKNLSSLENFVALLNASGLNDYNVKGNNFIENAVSYNYFENQNEDHLPANTLDFVKNLVCSAESTTKTILAEDGSSKPISFKENCLANYDQLLPRVSSVAIDYNANKELVVTLQWNSAALNGINSTIYQTDSNLQTKELGIFEISPNASQVNDVNLYGIYADLPSSLPPKRFDAEGNEITEEDYQKQHPHPPTLAEEDEDTRVAKKTMFYLNPRHITLSEKDQLIFNSSFQKPYGLHPVHQVSLKGDKQGIIKRNITSNKLSIEPPMNKEIFDCELFSYYRLPNLVFIDQNEFKNSNKPTDLPVQLVGLWGEADLEKPSYQTEKWGSNAFFRINVETRTGSHKDPNDELHSVDGYADLYSLKLHSRYQSVSSDETSPNYANEHIPKPDVFWACELSKSRLYKAFSDGEITKSKLDEIESTFNDDLVKKNPLDSKSNLNMEGLFTDNTLFYHLTLDYDELSDVAAANRLTNSFFQDKFQIPRGNASDNLNIQFFTLIAVMLSVVYLLKKVFTGYSGGIKPVKMDSKSDDKKSK